MKMFFGIISLLIAAIIIVSLFFIFTSPTLAPVNPYELGSVCIKENCFEVELAKTSEQISRGLMYRKELSENMGMLFVFDREGIYPFWMKNTLIPLDMVWISSDSKVVSISQNAQPCKTLICPSIIPSAKAKYVLEVNSGVCQKINLKKGDELKINIK